jgi:signal transduction histidine kinase
LRQAGSGPHSTPASDLVQSAARMQKLFDAADNGVRRIAGTVDLMMRYSREGYTRTTQPYDVYAAVKDVLGLLSPSTAFPIAIETELDGDGRIECVPEELNQVLTNLLENAMHAVPCDGSGAISVFGANEDGMLVLRVRDNGVGIAAEDLSRIFTAFYTTKDVGHGTGLGLTIAWRVVTSLGGTLSVRSAPGEGAEFVVRVPRYLQRREANVSASAQAALES